jgi:Flp pilus assembly protein CpaB
VAAQKRSNNLIIMLGLLTAVVGGGLVLLLASRGGDDGPSASSGSRDTVPVLVAKKNIAVGTAGADIGDAVEVRQVPSVTRSSDALVSVGELANRTTSVAIGPGQQLRSAFFRQRTVRGEAIKVPEGKQAVSLTIPFGNSGGGYVGPGDRVNVYAMVGRQNGNVAPLCGDGLCPGTADPKAQQASTQLVLPNVEILDISQEVAPSVVTQVTTPQGAVSRVGGTQPKDTTVLVALDAAQAERALFFVRFGEIYMTLVPAGQPDSATTGRDQTNALKP